MYREKGVIKIKTGENVMYGCRVYAVKLENDLTRTLWSVLK